MADDGDQENRKRARAYAIWEQDGQPEAGMTSTGPKLKASFGIKFRSRLQLKRRARAQPAQLQKQRRENAATRRRPVRWARARIFVRLAEALAKSDRSVAGIAAAPAR
jgi:hypothetical protein